MLSKEEKLYLLAILENCSQFTLKRDPRTGSVYPYIRLKIVNDELRYRVKSVFVGTVSKYYLILSHKKAKNFLDNLSPTVYREKIELVDQLYNNSFARAYKRSTGMRYTKSSRG
ncbi:MAG: hypothetical protein N2Z80_00145 [Hydrogenothermaceae bacterium]|nr:hypothetical protein [Hydrogenothermaceae bacterium]